MSHHGAVSKAGSGSIPNLEDKTLDMSERSVTSASGDSRFVAAGGSVAKAEHGEEVVVSIAIEPPA